MKKGLFRVAFALAMIGGVNMAAVADDVTETIKEALGAYEEGAYTKAAEDLAYALELVKQKKGENLRDYLPPPLEGWKADEAVSQTAGTAMMGGGTMVSRLYRKGSAEVTIEVMTDSPMMQSFAMMMANPMFATSDGGKMVRIKRQKGIITYDKQQRSGDIKLVVGNRFMVTVTGLGVDEADLTAYAEAIDFARLSRMP